MDSLGAIELRNSLNDVFGLNLSATLLFDHPTMGQLASYTLKTLNDHGFPQTAQAKAKPSLDSSSRISEVNVRDHVIGVIESLLGPLKMDQVSTHPYILERKACTRLNFKSLSTLASMMCNGQSHKISSPRTLFDNAEVSQ